MSKHLGSAPEFVKFFAPVVATLRELGGSGRPDEVRSAVAKALSISEEEQARPLPSGVQTRFENQVHWARFYLAKAGIIDSSQRGVWTLTEKGRSLPPMSPTDAREIFRGVQAGFAKTRKATTTEPGNGGDVEVPGDTVDPLDTSFVGYREAVATKLQSLPPSGFERFCQRLLRESGFEEVTVTGRSGDGGIDGIGVLQVNPLVSFKVLFQCKRYIGSVTPSQVRDFRGAMMGRADKGIIVTTGSFTAEARREAIRDGVPPIELVDGAKLVDMLEQLELGLKPRRIFELDDAFFDEFAK